MRERKIWRLTNKKGIRDLLYDGAFLIFRWKRFALCGALFLHWYSQGEPEVNTSDGSATKGRNKIFKVIYCCNPLRCSAIQRGAAVLLYHEHLRFFLCFAGLNIPDTLFFRVIYAKEDDVAGKFNVKWSHVTASRTWKHLFQLNVFGDKEMASYLGVSWSLHRTIWFQAVPCSSVHMTWATSAWTEAGQYKQNKD